MSGRVTTYVSRHTAVAGLMVTLALALPALAQASPPSASTEKAGLVSFGSATLHGSVDPHGSDTSYYFQYGPTKAYGSQTGLLDAGAATHSLAVAIAVTGLQPLTQYHYRLVAVNASGPVSGGDRTFLTTKVPLSLAILGSPNPVSYGGTVTIQGTLSGTNNTNREVVLQANAFPFTVGFANVGNPELTNATGGFSFPFLGLTQATQFRVVTVTSPPIVSPIAFEGVSVRISAHVGHVGRRHKALFHGTVSPAIDGMGVAIMRVIHGRDVFVNGTVLRHASTTSSRFSRLTPVKRGGVYRVLVHVTDGALTSTYSAPLVVR